MKASRGQIAKIHVIKKQLGLDEETYRAALEGVTGKRSCGEMSYAEAGRVIEHFVARGAPLRNADCGLRQNPKSETRNPKSKFEELRDRPGMASPQELRKIEAMWADVAYGDPAATLRRFLFKRWQVSALRFLTARQAWEVIEAIKAIAARRRPRPLRNAECGLRQNPKSEIRNPKWRGELHDGGR